MLVTNKRSPPFYSTNTRLTYRITPLASNHLWRNSSITMLACAQTKKRKACWGPLGLTSKKSPQQSALKSEAYN